jgi:hypothetical protein
MEGFTGRPEINKKSKSINRKIDDLYEWKQSLDRKNEFERQLKRYIEDKEFKKMQSRKLLSKQSYIYAERWSARGNADSKGSKSSGATNDSKELTSNIKTGDKCPQRQNPQALCQPTVFKNMDLLNEKTI